MKLTELKHQKQDFGETIEELERKVHTYKGLALEKEL